MLELILNPVFFQGGIVILAIATPLLAFLLKAKLPPRIRLVLGGFGPYVAFLWILHNGLQAFFGFASVIAVLTILTVSIASGLAAGFYIRPEVPASSQN